MLKLMYNSTLITTKIIVNMKNNLSAIEKQEITEVLTQFGLRDREQKVYLIMLTMGKTSLTPLAKKTGFPITTVQSIVSRLSEIGLLNVTQNKSRHLFEAHEPTVFKKILESQIQDFNSVIPLLNKIKSDEVISPKIKIYFRERVADILSQAVDCGSKEVWEIISAANFQKTIGEKFHFTKRRVENKVHLRSLRVETEEIKKYSAVIHARELREAKFLPRELNFTASIMLWDNTIAFFSSSDEGLAWTVTSKSMTETFKQLFELLWSVSRKMETF